MYKRRWRGCKEWKNSGSPLSTASDVASQMYDASLDQIFGFYDDPSIGGLSGSIEATIEVDPYFVLGHVVKIGSKLFGTYKLLKDDPIRAEFKSLENITRGRGVGREITNLEQLHIEALSFYIEGDLPKAVTIWDTILTHDPFDLLPLRFAFFALAYMGKYLQARDMVTRVLSAWRPDMPMYGYLLGMQAFGLQESNLFNEAETKANEALACNKNDVYAIHALSHVYEMQGKQDKGIQMMSETHNDWNMCKKLSCHIQWHHSLYHVEKGNFKEAIDIFDDEMFSEYKDTQSMRSLVDGTSLLYRLQVEGVDVVSRWRDMHELCKKEELFRRNNFMDVHFLQLFLGAGDKDATHNFMESFKDAIRENSIYSQTVSQKYLFPLCQAMQLCEDGFYSKAVEMFYPVRYDIIEAGASNAQRDMYNIFLIDAALKSSEPMHNKLARMLLAERKANKENSGMTDRLIERSLASH